MPRPFSWIARLPDIRRSVANSQRSHYTRRELEVLLKTSPRGAGRVLELLATDRVTDAHMVERERLREFLEGVSETSDVAALCAKIRADRRNITRVKVRHLCLRDLPEVPFASLRHTIDLKPGHLGIDFESPLDLLEQMLLLFQAADDDPVAFERACRRPETESPEAAEARWYQNEIERMDKLIRAPGSASHSA